MAIEIVDLPIKNGGSFHSYVNVYQMVYSLRDSPKIIVNLVNFRQKIHFIIDSANLKSQALLRNYQSLALAEPAIGTPSLGPFPAAHAAAWSWRRSGLPGRACHTW